MVIKRTSVYCSGLAWPIQVLQGVCLAISPLACRASCIALLSLHGESEPAVVPARYSRRVGKTGLGKPL